MTKNHLANWRRPYTSSAWAKYADALRSISLTRFNSRFSRSSCWSRSRSEVDMPPRKPRSVSDCRTHLRNVSAVQPIFDEIDSSAAHCDSYSFCCSCTKRTARSRTSGEYLTYFFITLSPQKIESSVNPGRFNYLFLKLFKISINRMVGCFHTTVRIFYEMLLLGAVFLFVKVRALRLNGRLFSLYTNITHSVKNNF